MASRKGKDKKAIDDSLHFEEAPKAKQKKPAEIGSDIDQELWSFFSGGYVGDLGLRSTMGSALERAAFELGPSSGSMPSGFNDFVRFGVNGPAGRVEAGRVARALSKLMGPCPIAIDREGRDVTDKNLKREWPHYFAVLKAFYTQRSTSYYEGIMGAFQEHSGVALVVPKGRDHVSCWCADQRTEELESNEKAILEARKDAGKRLLAMQEELKGKLHKWRREALEKSVEGALKPISSQDTTANIMHRWSSPSEEDALAALRALVKASNGSKDVPTRKAAKAILQGILDEARTLRWNARTAYVGERRKVDSEIRDRPKKQDAAEVAAWAANLPFINAETD